MIKLEKTLEFCVPIGLNETESYNRKHLERPFSWGIFIPLIVIFRFLRFGLSSVTVALGKGLVSPKHMVRWNEAKKSKFSTSVCLKHLAVVETRRYYRSIQHFAIRKYSIDEKALREARIMRSRFWRLMYRISESIIERNSPLEESLRDAKVSERVFWAFSIKLLFLLKKCDLQLNESNVEEVKTEPDNNGATREDPTGTDVKETFLYWNRAPSKKSPKSKLPSKTKEYSFQSKQGNFSQGINWRALTHLL